MSDRSVIKSDFSFWEDAGADVYKDRVVELKYPIRVYPVRLADKTLVFVCESLSLKGCVSQSENPFLAIRQLAENEEEWIKCAKKCGIPIPEK